MFWFWFFVGPAISLAIFALRGERNRARFVAERLATDSASSMPPASVIVALDEAAEDLGANLAALSSLDYPDYELIIAANRAADIPPGVLPRRVTVVLSGTSDPLGAKTAQNFLAGVRATRKRSEIFAFADPGWLVRPAWLRALVEALATPGAGVSTGFRWYLPMPPDFWSLMRSVWNAPLAGMLGPGNNPLVWPGAMAIPKESLFVLHIDDWWRRGANVAGAVAKAVHREGLKIAFAPGAMTACAVRTGAREFFSQARREMAAARTDYPRLWWSGLVSHFFYCGGMAAAITAAARGYRGAEWALVVQLGLGMLKGVNRAAIAKAELPDREPWFKRHAWVHAWWTPLATWVWLGVLVASMLPATPRSSRQRARQPDPPHVS
ncbi:MAG TPA: glycosyltransferase family 2 protein [Bryobacteraceae bacterium]|nr:glycosyltransferase family 2 protein [Bryobacteraceae bacterium]